MAVVGSPGNVEHYMSWGPFRELAGALGEVGGSLTGLEVPTAAEQPIDVAIFMVIPRQPVNKLLAGFPDAEPWVVLLENEVVWPRNWDLGLHEQFAHVFTWDDSLVDGRRYHKVNYPYDPPRTPGPGLSGKTGFCTLVAANKIAYHPRELYSERVKLIRWYERRWPGLFDLYGHGWDRPAKRLGPPPRGLIKAMATLERGMATSRPYTSWRGPTDDKISTLSQYRFAIAYENARDMSGYITEKLFDCMAAGTVGVYWGSKNVTDWVPPECFVDRLAFRSVAELHEFLTKMDESTYQGMLEASARFLEGPAMHPFSNSFTVRAFMSQIEAFARRP